MEKQKKQVIIIIGPPGGGKGTQATLLSERLSLYYFETSKVIEAKIMNAQASELEEIDGQKYPLTEEKRKWEQGELVSPPLVTVWVKNEIKSLFEAQQGIIFAGSPRSLYEAENLMPFLKNLYGSENIKIFLIKQGIEESVWRNSHRRLCELMRHPILYLEENKDLKLCPLDGSKLIKRSLDKPEVIKERFRIYEKQTLPIIDYFKDNGFPVMEINGEQTVAEVFTDIIKNL